jgi:aldehyde:ferredoxin oxidoreductase
VKVGGFKTRHPVRVEFFCLASFGTNLYNDNLESIIRAVELCNGFGLDIAETGARLAFLMECQQRGLVRTADTDGYDFSWGNAKTVVEMIPKIANREGVGHIMGQNILDLAQHVGQGAEAFAIHIKGMTLEYMDPRANNVYGSRLRVASRGGDHLRAQGAGGAHALDEMPFKQGVKELTRNEIACVVHDMMGVCKFPYGIISATRDRSRLKTEVGLPWLHAAVTGTQTTWEKLSLAAERVINLERMLNIREGATREDDDLPLRLAREPIPFGEYEGSTYDIGDEFIEEYYAQRQWDAKGIPTNAKLRELSLDVAP